MSLGAVCAHGSLARKCEICERDERIAELEAENARLRDKLTSLRDRYIKSKGGLGQCQLCDGWDGEHSVDESCGIAAAALEPK